MAALLLPVKAFTRKPLHGDPVANGSDFGR
jgi:hypothetical protein